MNRHPLLNVPGCDGARIRSFRQGGWIVAIAAVLLLGIAVVAEACNVPVFRYALEHWRSDPYRVTLLHQGPLSDDQQKLLAELQDRQDQALANIIVRTVDLKSADLEGDEQEADRVLAASQSEQDLPRLVLQYPLHLKIEQPLWSAPLEKASVEALLASGLRKQIVERLAAGQTAVWLLLECSDAAKNDAAHELLTKELKELEGELELPELTDAPSDNLLAAPPLGITFSLLRVPREAAEAPLVGMLVNAEPDLPGLDEPMVFPVFGRGRALLPLVGAGVTAENLHNSAGFLVGACSCEVKELNPGFDILLAADWEGLLFQDGKAPPEVARSEPAPDAPAVLVPIPTGSKAAPAAAVAQPSPTNIAVASPVVVDNSISGSLWHLVTKTRAGIVGGMVLTCLVLVGGVAAFAGLFGGSPASTRH